jgi:hypothetical protein
MNRFVNCVKRKDLTAIAIPQTKHEGVEFRHKVFALDESLGTAAYDGCDFYQCVFSGITIMNDFVGCRFIECRFEHVRFSGARFIAEEFRDCEFYCCESANSTCTGEGMGDLFDLVYVPDLLLPAPMIGDGDIAFIEPDWAGHQMPVFEDAP